MTFAAGDRPTAAQLEDIRGLRVYKTFTETVNNSATMQNDDELFLAVAASTTYVFNCMLVYSSNTTADFKFAWTYPTGATAQYLLLGTALSGTALSTFQRDAAAGGILEGSVSNQAILMTGTWTISTTAGTLQLQWAQNTANASNTQVLLGSYLELKKVG